MDVTQGAASELRALADLINNAVKQIETTCTSCSQTYPLADHVFTPQSEAVRMNPDISEAGSIIVAAATQLVAAVRIPATTLSIISGYCNVAEILREAGPQGLHANEIAAKTGVDSVKLARCLRLLVTNHVFLEVSVDVFSNNRLSSLLDTGKPVVEILKSPDTKYDGTSGITAILEHIADDGGKSAEWLPETLMDKKFGNSQEPNETAFNKAFSTSLPMFPWLELPENAERLKRFGIGMEGLQNMMPPNMILQGYNWKGLPQGSVVVDVGGGIGLYSLVLAKEYKHLEFIVQDRDAVIADATKYWAKQFPQAVEAGRVKLLAHDFFTAQPVKKPAVFLLRTILHDWADKYCVKILTELRKGAGPNTQLLVVDNTIEYACEDNSLASDIPGAALPRPPAPLLANKGAAEVNRYYSDVHMMTLLNGDERTVARFHKLFDQCGWKLTKVVRIPGALANTRLIAVPA